MSDTLNRRYSGISEQALDELRSRMNHPITDTVEPWCYEVTRDNIRHYAHGIGDDNPLWCDPDYARETKYGDIIALPSFIFPCDRVFSGYVGGLPGVHAMFAGIDVTWHKPMQRNDEISTEAMLKDLIPHETRFSGLAIQQIYNVKFYNQFGDLCADGDSWCFRTDRDIAREQGTKYAEQKARGHKVYTEEELAEINHLYGTEEIRGANPRFWEDVNEGDTLRRMVKGPMTITGFIAYAQGWGGLYIRAHKMAYKLQKSHQALGINNKYGVPDCPERVHWEPDFASEVGAPGAYDYGPERCSWLSHTVTNWMGDDGFLRKLKAQIRHHNVEGDTLFIDGKVTRKFRSEEGKPCVEIALKGINQNDDLSIEGSAEVELPSRAKP
ncbi:MaoC family dehydratase N-terminal domain-containing protein [Litorivivens sp.]|uniref:FAS1-like dehydratase domain-containing protein n=1 Tax=Litorivivens sp. TaxID=2020868 RepID=UPI003566CC89